MCNVGMASLKPTDLLNAIAVLPPKLYSVVFYQVSPVN